MEIMKINFINVYTLEGENLLEVSLDQEGVEKLEILRGAVIVHWEHSMKEFQFPEDKVLVEIEYIKEEAL